MKRKSLLLLALIGIIVGISAPASVQACTFCNLTGFVNCESFTGTACSAPQPNRRCYINPPCACEWGFCRCDAATNTWICIW